MPEDHLPMKIEIADHAHITTPTTEDPHRMNVLVIHNEAEVIIKGNLLQSHLAVLDPVS